MITMFRFLSVVQTLEEPHFSSAQRYLQQALRYAQRGTILIVADHVFGGFIDYLEEIFNNGYWNLVANRYNFVREYPNPGVWRDL
jgi:hypothetical protein